MKILFFSTLEITQWGGSEQLWADMALKLLSRGHAVITNTMEWNEIPPAISGIAAAGGVLTFRPNPHIHGKLSDAVSNKLKDYKWKTDVMNFAPDVVFISQGGTYDNAVIQHGGWLRTLEKPVYVLCQFMAEYEYKQKDTREFFIDFFSSARNILFVSERNKEVAGRIIAHDITNAIVIKNPVRIKETTRKYPGTDVYNIAIVARLDTEVKGYDIVTRVFAQPQWKDRNYRVQVYGSGVHEEYIRALVKYYDLEDKVIFMGFENDMVRLWEENHILLLASRGEGTPLALLEANYCKRAAVVTDVGGNAEIITEGYNGFVAEAAVPYCVAQAMERAWERRADWEQMGLAAKEHIDRLYVTDAVDDAVNLVIRG